MSEKPFAHPPLPEPPKTDWSGRCLLFPAGRSENAYCRFERRFTAGKDGLLRIAFTASAMCNLYLDGEFLCRGPARGQLEGFFYEERAFPVTRGPHTLTALVHNLGVECATHRKCEGFFLADCFCGEENLSTGESWTAVRLDAYRETPAMLSHFGFQEDVDLRLLGAGTPVEPCTAIDPASLGVTALVPDRLRPFVYAILTPRVYCRGSAADGPDTGDFFLDACRRLRIVERFGGELPVGGAKRSFAVFELEETVSGTVILDVSGAGGEEVCVSFDDRLSAQGLVNPGRTYARYTDRYLLAAGRQTAETAFPRGFRYLLIDLPEGAVLHGVRVRAERYDYSAPAAAGFSDAFLDGLVEQSLRTTRICTIDGFSDCVTRERVLWMQDLYTDSLSVFYHHQNPEIVRQLLFTFAQGQRGDGRLITYTPSDLTWCCNPPGTFLWMQLVVEYLNFTGDRAGAALLLPAIDRLLRYLSTLCGGDGLICRWYGDEQFWDWSENELEGTLTLTNACLLCTISMLREHPFFQTLESLRLFPDAAVLRRRLRALLLRGGLFRDAILPDGTPSPVRSQLANGMALLAGLFEDGEAREAARRVVDPSELENVTIGEQKLNDCRRAGRTKIIPAGTLAGAMLVCQGLFESGCPQEAMEYLRAMWGPYRGLRTLPEMRQNGTNNTVCHGWAAAPAFLLPRYVLGLSPTDAGWAKARLRPHTDGLERVFGTFATPHGELSVAVESDRLAVSVPAGVRLHVEWGGWDEEVTACRALTLARRGIR